MSIENKRRVKQGWQCPVCGAVNSPYLTQCPCDGDPKKAYIFRTFELFGNRQEDDEEENKE